MSRSPTPVTPADDPFAPATLPARLVLFDGVCAVCDAAVQWLLDHDANEQLHYAPLQGPTGQAILARHPELPHGLDSIVFVEQVGGSERLTVHSGAILRIAAVLPTPWRVVAVLRWVPRLLRDPAYRAFAAVRYRIFGQRDACRIPTPSESARFRD